MRQLIPALLLLTLLVPAAAAVEVPITRAQFLSALWTWAGALPCGTEQPFSDIPEGSPWEPAICWAHHQGLVGGYSAPPVCRQSGPGCLLSRNRPVQRL